MPAQLKPAVPLSVVPDDDWDAHEGPVVPKLRPDDELPAAPNEAYRQVGEEVLRKRFDPECWARALAASGGRDDDPIIHYTRIRTESLLDRKKKELRRSDELERRRMRYCSPEKRERTPPETSLGENKSRYAVVDTFFWHVVGIVALVGALLAGHVLCIHFGWSLSPLTMVMIVAAVQALPLLGWWIGRTHFHTLTYGGAVQTFATIWIILSLFVGTHLLTRPASKQMALDYKPPIPAVAPPASSPKASAEAAPGEEESKPLLVRE